MKRHLLHVEEVEALIRRGEPLLLAGDEAPLRRLPAGRWIGGTIPYFMTEEGGVVDRRRIFVERLPGLRDLGVRRYDEGDIGRVYVDLPPDALGVMIAPSWSRVHLAFGLNAPRYDRFATAPLLGWIAGVHLSEVGKATPKVFDGASGEVLEQEAVVMHLGLPRGKVAELAILNIFEMGEGPAITFPTTGFSATMAEIDGSRRNLAAYVREAGLDTRLPLVADYCGARINVSFHEVDDAAGEVRFFGPVFAGVSYRHARPVADYVDAFVSALPRGVERDVVFSCNCILNYVHSSLEGRTTGRIVGPITFGEIAYQLLNQTMVYLTLSER
ncbi:DUF6976 family protein [Anaeromyxobacter oryzae]|uniref:Uncharacterized protein n=1 Tax=Anaeromyxobacter oryzae TaxID=2918170 RepID=A0ABM7X0F8_9BACT|nr:hypothetical protein [Anaeromyxobacter oryzae]BDG05212.1 hypothetical protein AMOR_42080 [Anaeromyxobacter oryzae]